MRLLIDSFALAPVAGAKDSDDAASIREANRQDAATHPAKAEVTLFRRAMCQILGEDAILVKERRLSGREADAVPGLICPILARIPFEGGFHVQ